MEYNTSELCVMYIDVVDVVEPMFSNYGGCSSFGGSISTIKCFEDNGLITDALEEDGEGKVLLVDGGEEILLIVKLLGGLELLANTSELE